ncbi:MAG: HpsJ family protein [Cyanobacteriota bacterium]
MGAASTGRLGHLLRWLGLTLVVLLGVQVLALLAVWNWDEEAYRQLLIDRLVSQSPMALVGLILMCYGIRIDKPGAGRTPLGWLVGVLAALLALANIVAVPLTISGDRTLADQTNQQLTARQGQLAMARAQLANASPEALDQFAQQAERAGQQLPGTANLEERRRLVKQVVERQLQQAEEQLRQQQQAQALSVTQRRIGGTGSATVLAIAFALLALAALL